MVTLQSLHLWVCLTLPLLSAPLTPLSLLLPEVLLASSPLLAAWLMKCHKIWFLETEQQGSVGVTRVMDAGLVVNQIFPGSVLPGEIRK